MHIPYLNRHRCLVRNVCCDICDILGIHLASFSNVESTISEYYVVKLRNMPKEEKFKPHVGLLFLAVQFIFEFFPLSARYPWMFLWFLKIGLCLGC